MIRNTLLTASVVLASAATQAVTVLEPTELPCGCQADVDFNKVVVPMLNFDSLPVGSIHIFDGSITEADFSTSSNIEVILGDDVEFTMTGSDFIASNINGSLNLGSTPDFVVALYLNGNWIADTGFMPAAPGSDQGTLAFGDDFINIIDVQEVPVPAAAWLFGSALIGMIGMSRRNQ